MRIARFSAPGADPAFGVVELAADEGEHPDSVAQISGDPLAGPVRYTGARFALDDVRLLAPVIPRSKVVCLGFNWAQHAAEMTAPVPSVPTIFIKPNTSVIGPGQPIVAPPETHDLQYEGELAIVIGRICRRVPLERVPEVIFGYTCANDVTARDLQRDENQWTRAKGFDTFCPLGPWIVTNLDVAEASDLTIRTTLDGALKQEGTTADMVRGIAEIVAFISGFATLLPGDVILSGTPAGVGPMLPGQEVAISISGIGTLANPVVAED
ncbi:MAG: fumarylacetoacetate hydrolase family protein [Actinomycetia bacterium]|nr:fumarylacetoacetate hydrolase family protein [Actinomycetes bacterium]